MDTPITHWRAPLLWRAAQLAARGLVGLVGRLDVSGDVPEHLRRGPLVLAANHISPFDPVVLTAACQVRGIHPRIMATGGLFRAPVIGALMRRAGHIRVDRGTSRVHHSLEIAAGAVAGGSVVLVYPEGRIGLDPGMWPERGKTGAARLAFAADAAVVPVAQWGSHEVVPYRAPRGMLRGLARAVRRRPVIRVRFGAPVLLRDLHPGTPGAARRATDRIIDAITDELVPLRPDEPDRPRHVDPGRPTETTRTHRRRPAR
ncbi:lysophospholipid acyltransferase family protein [Micromonospora chaiyaphumensis]|uniref:1-acyl-sn-glycerol-3-phosphate acyltransferases n=1 Tax=Micromonospora chaiyaphumensis TaxID=307119 RepID=A0A1C4TZJ3_9ACTN|nr:lysophospholipid acyltransferase family protein [Micromonospora chaiyaphumensis]SCE64860.1 1-acyl-sn-glycerol-3-phosphate acyltransferases [Micromonospora chaiyaphumensis]